MRDGVDFGWLTTVLYEITTGRPRTRTRWKDKPRCAAQDNGEGLRQLCVHVPIKGGGVSGHKGVTTGK